MRLEKKKDGIKRKNIKKEWKKEEEVIEWKKDRTKEY